MPIYCYECDECKLSFDRFNSVADRFYHECPECGEVCGKVLSMPAMAVDTRMCDINGTPVWYPSTGGKHYDRVLKKTFYSKKEKVEYMKENNLMMDGSDAPNWRDERCGDMRNRSYRRELENLKAPIT